MSERTEEATPKRVHKARAQGQVAQSRDAVATAALAGTVAALWISRDGIDAAFRASLTVALRAAATPGTARVAGALAMAASRSLGALVPSLLAGVAAATLTGALLTGFVVAPAAALPALERLDPSKALARYGKARTYLEPVLQLARGLVLLAIAWTAVRGVLAALLAAPRSSAPGLARLFGVVASAVLIRVVAAAALFAGLDVLYRRWLFARELRMTKDEVKREHKESEGDPQTRAARERLHKEILAEAALARVREASFVVTNPTHYAVALAWDEATMEAPELIAKGEGERARRIIAEAHRAGIAILRDAPLARSLHELELGAAIPEALYEAVAAVVGYLADGHDPDRYDEDASRNEVQNPSR